MPMKGYGRLGGDATTDGGAEFKRRLDEYIHDPESPYWKQDHPGHQKAVEVVTGLYRERPDVWDAVEETYSDRILRAQGGTVRIGQSALPSPTREELTQAVSPELAAAMKARAARRLPTAPVSEGEQAVSDVAQGVPTPRPPTDVRNAMETGFQQVSSRVYNLATGRVKGMTGDPGIDAAIELLESPGAMVGAGLAETLRREGVSPRIADNVEAVVRALQGVAFARPFAHPELVAIPRVAQTLRSKLGAVMYNVESVPKVMSLAQGFATAKEIAATGLPTVMKNRMYVTRGEVLGYLQAVERAAKLEGAAVGGGGAALGAAPRLFLREEE